MTFEHSSMILGQHNNNHMMLEQAYQQFTHRVVRDLAWALFSPPLLKKLEEQLESSAANLLAQDYIDDEQAIYQWLLSIDQHPEPLLEYVQLRSQVRIGIYFEQLLGFYFNHYPRFSLISQNLQVQGEKRTLGEFDFIVYDKKSDEYFHIESAVKFYLGHFEADGGLNNIEHYNWHRWIGPNKKDSLSLKMNSMLNKQLQLSQTSEAKQLLNKINVNVDQLQTRLLLRGRFFYSAKNQEAPVFSHPKACLNRWHTLDEFLHTSDSQRLYTRLPKTHWLSPLTTEDSVSLNSIYDKNTLINLIQEEIKLGVSTWLVCDINNRADMLEQDRFFIVV